MKRALLGLLAAAALCSRVAAADDEAAATQLFNAGRDMMKRGEFAAACPKLAESARLRATVGALAKLAECDEHEQRLASAYGRWQQALNLARANGDERVGDVQRELARLDAIVPKLRVTAEVLPPEAILRVDDVELGPAGLGVPLPVDGGRHTVEASAPGKRTWTTTVETAPNGATTTVAVPALEDTPVAPAAPVVASPSPAESTKGGSSAWRTIGLVTAGAGLGALAAGGALGVEAMRHRDDANCPGNVCPDTTSADTLRTAKGLADWSTVLFVAGGALLGGGVTAWWLARDHGSQTGWGVTPGGVAGSF